MGRYLRTYIGATNIISALGFSTQENFNNLVRGVSGIDVLCGTNICAEKLVAGKVAEERLGEYVARYHLESYLLLEQLMILSIMDVVEQSGIDLSSDSSAIVVSTTKGNIELLARCNGLADERVYLWDMAQRVADYFHHSQRPIVVSSACISGVSSLIVASRLLRAGKYQNVVVVGGDLLTRFVVSGFASFKSLSGRCCRPYDVSRDGLTLGEACGAILVTTDGNLSTGVTIEGGAITNDANHISGPSRTGDGLSYAMDRAMSQGGVQPLDVSFINAHGTATVFNDEMESKAIYLSGLQDVPVNSLKSYFGHTLGAAGVIESVICVEQLKAGLLLGTQGFEKLGVPQPILVSDTHFEMEMKCCLKTASGFGGCNAAMVLALEKYAKDVEGRMSVSCSLVRTCGIVDGEIRVDDKTIQKYTGDFSEFVRVAFKTLNRPNMKFYKMDDLCKLGYLTTEYLLDGYTYTSSELAIVLANRSSSLDTDSKHQEILNRESECGVSPAVFVYTLPNVVLGEICIHHRIQGENTFFINRDVADVFLDGYAQILLEQGGYRAVVYGWCEKMGEEYSSQMKLIEKR